MKAITKDIKAIGTFVVVKRDLASNVTEGGLEIPSKSVTILNSGVVLSVGTGCPPNSGLLGKRIAFMPGPNPGMELPKQGSHQVLAIPFDQVAAIVPKEA